MLRKLKNSELNRLEVEEFKEAAKMPITLVLDNVRSFHNVGSVFRTADGFRVDEILLCGITPCPPHREIRKTALGASEAVKWRHFEHTLDAIAYLKAKNIEIYGIEQAEPKIFLNNFEPTQEKAFAFVFGHEVDGVAANVLAECDACIEIPQYGTKHSFNISVSVAIVLWHLHEKLNYFSK